jgi:RNA polymerase sigma-70 factor (ECF subfamily)
MNEPEFSTLFRDTNADLLAFLLRRCSTAEDAADCLAETYLVAWEKRRRMPKGDETRPWLFGVARNVMRRGRERHHRASGAARALAGELVTVGALAPPPALGDSDPIAQALGELAEIDREIMTMIAWDGLSPREVAAALGISGNVVRVRAHRARARLRSLLAADPARSLSEAKSRSAAG